MSSLLPAVGGATVEETLAPWAFSSSRRLIVSRSATISGCLSVYCSSIWSIRAWYDAICESIGEDPTGAVRPKVGSSPCN